MVFILIGVVAAAFGLLDYFEIVDAPASTTSLVLTGVGAVTILSAVAQVLKRKTPEPKTDDVAPDLALQMANGVAQTPAVPAMPVPAANGTPTTNGVATNGVATNGVATNGAPVANETTGDGELVEAPAPKQGLWSKLNKPVGGKEPKETVRQDKGKRESRRAKRQETAELPTAQAAPVAPLQPGVATSVAVAEPEEKNSLWKRLNKPVGKGADESEGPKGRRGRRHRDEDNGPLFPNGVPDTPDPFAAAPEAAHAAPGMPAPGMPVPASPGPRPIAANQGAVPGAQAEADLWQEQQAAGNGAMQAPPVPEVPQAPLVEQASTEQAGAPHDVTAGTATAVAEPPVEASRRGRRVCNYCWEPNDPTAVACGACGSAL